MNPDSNDLDKAIKKWRLASIICLAIGIILKIIVMHFK